MSIKNSDYYFLKGGGEMGALIRAKDWSKTSLGDPENWPKSLCTMVAVMLDNPFGMYIAWGNEYIQLYNDGYRPILGSTKHPQALGISTRETFSEIWDIIGSMFDGVMEGKAVGFPDFMLPLNRNGFVEKCYFDFSYSPIRKDDGDVGGVLVTVIETTEKKRALEAINESNSRYINNILQAPVAMCIFRGKNHVVEIANEKMLNLWGKQANEVMNKPIFEGLPEAKNQGLEELVDKVYTTGEKFIANERPVNLPRNGKVETTYINFVYDALKESDGSISGIVAIAYEVTPQVSAREKVKDSEQKVRTVVENAPFPIAVYAGKEMIIEMANQSIIDLWGKGNDVIGKSFKEVLPELDNQFVFDQIKKVFITGESFHTKNTPLDLIIDNKIRTYYFNYSFTPLYDISGNIYAVMNTGVDLTDLNIAKKKVEESDKRFRNTIKQAPVGITILRGPQYIVEMANEAYLQLIDKTEIEFLGNPLFTSLPEVEETVHILLDKVLNTGVPYHGNEVSMPVNRYGKKELCYFDFLYYPLKEEDGKISGVMATVTEVTEKVESRKIIEEKKRLYEAITQNTPDLIYVFDLNYKFTYANEALLKMWGRTWDDSIGKGFLENGYEPWHAEKHKGEIDQVIATKKPIRGEVSFPHATLGKRVYDYIFVPVIGQDGEVEAIAGTTRDITPQIQAMKLIEESEKRFQAAVEAVQGILWTNNSKGEMEGEQKGWASLTGQTYEEYKGTGWTNAIHPDDAKPTLDAWTKAVKERREFIFEHMLKTKDGQWRDFSVRAIPLLDAEGALLQWVGVHTDITDIKQATKALKANEEKLTIVIEASELGTWEIDVKTNSVNASERFHEIMGYEQKNSLTLNDTVKSIHPNYLQLREEAFKKAYKTGVLWFLGQIIWEDNSIHWIENKGKVFYDDENNPILIIGTTADITKEKEQQQTLFESEQKFRLLADSMPQQVWTSDPNGNMTYFSQSVMDYSGLTLDQLHKEGWLQIVHPDDRKDNMAQWLHAVSTGEEFLFEHRFLRYDGKYRWQLSRAIPQKDEMGNIQMWVGASTDIQEQKAFTKELELKVKERTKELEESNMELQKMNKELQSFAYISSHDLQEPLRKIQMFATRISDKEENNLSNNGKDMFKRMQNSANRMQTLIQDLLAYSRTSTKEQKFETTNLNKVIDEIKEELHEELKEKHATIEANQLCDVDIIPFQFRQLMHNLIGNALKFSKPSRDPYIQIKTEVDKGINFHNKKLIPQNNYCHITISDNGIGFEQHYNEKIFEVFQRLHGKNEYEGTGIGLSIVKKIVENHNGFITATGEINKGTTFDIYLPSR